MKAPIYILAAMLFLTPGLAFAGGNNHSSEHSHYSKDSHNEDKKPADCDKKEVVKQPEHKEIKKEVSVVHPDTQTDTDSSVVVTNVTNVTNVVNTPAPAPQQIVYVTQPAPAPQVVYVPQPVTKVVYVHTPAPAPKPATTTPSLTLGSMPYTGAGPDAGFSWLELAGIAGIISAALSAVYAILRFSGVKLY